MASDGGRDQERKVGKTCPHGSSQTRRGRRGEVTVVRPISSPAKPTMGDRSERLGGFVSSSDRGRGGTRRTGRGTVRRTGWGDLASRTRCFRALVGPWLNLASGAPAIAAEPDGAPVLGLGEYGSRAEGSTGTNLSDGTGRISPADRVVTTAPQALWSLADREPFDARSARVSGRPRRPQAPGPESPATPMASWISAQVLRFSWGDRSR